MTFGEAVGYISGLVDGEGSVGAYGKGVRCVAIYNTDLGILEGAVEALAVLGVAAKIDQRRMPANGTKVPYVIQIRNRKALLRLAQILQLRAETKQDGLKQIVGSYKSPNARLPRDCWPLGEVRSLLAQGRTYKQIAKSFSIDRSTAARWIREARK